MGLGRNLYTTLLPLRKSPDLIGNNNPGIYSYAINTELVPVPLVLRGPDVESSSAESQSHCLLLFIIPAPSVLLFNALN